MITSTRREAWGLLAYDRNADEFEAHISAPNPRPLVSRPISAGCLVTGKCNLRRPHCYGDEESLPAVELSVENWGRIFRHLRYLGLMRVDVSGGEPTLRRDLAQIVHAALEVGLEVVVSTNGIPLASKGVSGFPPVRWHVSIASGLQEIHERRRLLPVLAPSKNSLERTSAFIGRVIDEGGMLRVLTSIGRDNREALFALGEHLALLGVRDWNISRVIRAGRAQRHYDNHWNVPEEPLMEQISNLRYAFPFMRIRYSNRTQQDGYFLLVLPDGSLATQYTDGRDKVVLGRALETGLDELNANPDFSLKAHGEKWIAAILELQPGPEGRFTTAHTGSASTYGLRANG